MAARAAPAPLRRQLSQCLASEPHTRLRYFCSPHYQDSALYPFITQLGHAAQLARADTAEEKLEKLRALVAPGAQGNDEVELLAELLSLPNSAAKLNVGPQRKCEMLFAALLHQLEGLAARQPVLFLCEDRTGSTQARASFSTARSSAWRACRCC